MNALQVELKAEHEERLQEMRDLQVDSQAAHDRQMEEARAVHHDRKKDLLQQEFNMLQREAEALREESAERKANAQAVEDEATKRAQAMVDEVQARAKAMIEESQIRAQAIKQKDEPAEQREAAIRARQREIMEAINAPMTDQ
jgi:hypothetical protein